MVWMYQLGPDSSCLCFLLTKINLVRQVHFNLKMYILKESGFSKRPVTFYQTIHYQTIATQTGNLFDHIQSISWIYDWFLSSYNINGWKSKKFQYRNNNLYCLKGCRKKRGIFFSSAPGLAPMRPVAQ